MARERETGEARRRSVSPETSDMAIRLALAERAIADATARIAELTRVVAELTLGNRPAPPPAGQLAVVDADAVAPFALGFYQREFDRLGRPFRWTGKGDIFEIRLRLDRNVRWSFTIEVQPNPNVDAGSVRAFVDFVEVPATIDTSGKILAGTIPERFFSTMATLTFLLPNTFVPSVINPAAQDNRTLGLIFYELRASARPLDEETTTVETGEEADASRLRNGQRRTARPVADVEATAQGPE